MEQDTAQRVGVTDTTADKPNLSIEDESTGSVTVVHSNATRDLLRNVLHNSHGDFRVELRKDWLNLGNDS